MTAERSEDLRCVCVNKFALSEGVLLVTRAIAKLNRQISVFFFFPERSASCVCLRVCVSDIPTVGFL